MNDELRTTLNNIIDDLDRCPTLDQINGQVRSDYFIKKRLLETHLVIASALLDIRDALLENEKKWPAVQNSEKI